MAMVEGPPPAGTALGWRIAAWVVGAVSAAIAVYLALKAVSFLHSGSASEVEAHENGDLIGLSAGAMLMLGAGIGLASGLWRNRLWAKITLALVVALGIGVLVLLNR